MNDTKNYILGLRDTLAERLAGRFLFFLLLFALSCGGAFAVTSRIPCGGYFLAVHPLNTGGSLPHTAVSLIRCTLPAAVSLLIIGLSVHTAASQAVSAAVILWRGVCLGCAGALMADGTVRSLGTHWILALTLCFAASVLIILLAACTHVYSLGLCRAYADRTHRIRREIAGEYLRVFLILSGGVFLLTCGTVLMI
ncbi:MAG: hypothetical protein II333_06235 [Clostridia bacterium]|nr:hypothetical protein [Clostridia bacterium]